MTKINVDDGKAKKIVVTEKKPVRKIAVEKPVEKKSAPVKKKIEVSTAPKKIKISAAPKQVKVDDTPKQAKAKDAPKKKIVVNAVSSAETHSTVQKSTTLSRKYVKKPTKVEVASEQVAETKPEPIIEAKPAQPTKVVTAPQPKTEVKPVRRSPKIIKRSANSDRALKAASRAVRRAEKAEKRAERKSVPDIEHRFRKKNRGRRIFFAMICSAATVGALVAFVNINMPDISVRVAAMQTGIEATYPTFIPRYYSLANVESDKDGIVTMRFNGPDGASFTLSEEKSTWDSNALLNNYVKKYYPSDYTTLREQGITIYTRGENAAWVNGGLLYKIESTGKYLTKEQIRNIATSL